MYTGGKVSNNEYVSTHLWISRHYGTPKICNNQECPRLSKTFDWALKTGEEYKKSIKNFYRLCRICHKKYDLKIIDDSKFLEIDLPIISPGKTSLEKRKKVIRIDKSKSKLFVSIADACRELNVAKSGIISALKGRNKTAYGYVWKYCES